MTAIVEKSASDKANPTGEARAAKLIAWYNAGAGGRIKWGTPGAFDSCVRVATKHMRPDQAKGFCNLRSKQATGRYAGARKALALAIAKARGSVSDSPTLGAPGDGARTDGSWEGEVVSVLAKALHSGVESTLQVDRTGDRFQVRDAHAGDDPAEVVYVESVGDGTVRILPSDTVSKLPAKLAVAVAETSADSQQAGTEFGAIVGSGSLAGVGVEGSFAPQPQGVAMLQKAAIVPFAHLASQPAGAMAVGVVVDYASAGSSHSYPNASESQPIPLGAKKSRRLDLLQRLLKVRTASSIECPMCEAKVSRYVGSCPKCGTVFGDAARKATFDQGGMLPPGIVLARNGTGAPLAVDKAFGMKTSAMVALYPAPDAARALVLDGGEPWHALHVTLGFLGADAVVRLDRDTIEGALAAFAAVNGPLSGAVGGVARFHPQDGEPWPLVALVDAPGLTEFRQRLVGTLAAAGVDVASNHSYTAHCTLAMVEDEDEEAAAAILAEGIEATPLHFGSIVLAWGDDRTVFSLDGGPGAQPDTTAKALGGVRTYDEQRELLSRALRLAYATEENSYLYVRDLTDDAAVFELSGRGQDSGLYRVRYLLSGPDGDEVAFSTPEPVEARTDYVPTSAPGSADAPAIMKAVAGPVIKSVDAKRYTMAPLYPASPESPTAAHLDAHGDFATAEDLQQAVWDHVRKGDRTIRDQHRDGTAIGEWVEIVSWPYEVSVPMTKADGTTVEKSFAPGTVFLGVVWNEAGWSDIQKGVKTGYSLGGAATRVAVEMA